MLLRTIVIALSLQLAAAAASQLQRKSGLCPDFLTEKEDDIVEVYDKIFSTNHYQHVPMEGGWQISPLAVVKPPLVDIISNLKESDRQAVQGSGKLRILDVGSGTGQIGHKLKALAKASADDPQPQYHVVCLDLNTKYICDGACDEIIEADFCHAQVKRDDKGRPKIHFDDETKPMERFDAIYVGCQVDTSTTIDGYILSQLLKDHRGDFLYMPKISGAINFTISDNAAINGEAHRAPQMVNLQSCVHPGRTRKTKCPETIARWKMKQSPVSAVHPFQFPGYAGLAREWISEAKSLENQQDS